MTNAPPPAREPLHATPATEPPATPPSSSEAEAFAARLPEVNGRKCPTLQPGVAEGLLEELYRGRWEEGRRERRREILADQGQPTDWSRVCCLSGLPILRHARVRCFLLVREAQVFDSSSGVGYGGKYFERWRLVGLPLPGRHRYADSGVIASTTDIAWRCLRTYFRQRYRLRLQCALHGGAGSVWLPAEGTLRKGRALRAGAGPARRAAERPGRSAGAAGLQAGIRWHGRAGIEAASL